MLVGTTESPPERPQKSRRTLMSPQECEIAQGRKNQLEIKPNSPALAPEQFPVPHHTRQVALLPLCSYRGSLRHTSQVIGTPISAQEIKESSMHPILSQKET